MAAEPIVFSDMFDQCYTLGKEIGDLFNTYLPIQMYTDRKSLFDVISKGSRTAEKRLMLDLFMAREAFKKRKISNIGLVRSGDNVADALTNVNPS